jgi:hypothetical protein
MTRDFQAEKENFGRDASLPGLLSAARIGD